MAEKIVWRCGCSAEIPEETGGYLDDVLVCDDCYERAVDDSREI